MAFLGAVPLPASDDDPGTSTRKGWYAAFNSGIPLQGGSGAPASPTNGVPVALPPDFSAGEYETVAAGQTAQVIGTTTGGVGDYIAGLLVIPAVVACGAVTLLDGATSIPVFVGGGTTALPSCIPFFIPLGMKSVSGAWKVTTGANVSVIAIGNFV